MNRRPIVTTALAVLAAGACISGAALIEQRRERWYPPPPASADTLYVTSGPALRRMTIGYSAIAADIYWIRAVQYFGDIRIAQQLQAPAVGAAASTPGQPPESAKYSLLFPLLDLTTSLDPRFNMAY